MTPLNYLVFSIRANGWLTDIGTLTSNVKDAAHYDREDAIGVCNKDHEGNFLTIPVCIDDLDEVKK